MQRGGHGSRAAALLPLALLACAACGSGGASDPVMVSGEVLAVGGPPDTPSIPVIGQVTVLDADGRGVGGAPLDSASTYELHLPPGDYRLVITDASAPCPATPFHLAKGHDQVVNVVCPHK